MTAAAPSGGATTVYSRYRSVPPVDECLKKSFRLCRVANAVEKMDGERMPEGVRMDVHIQDGLFDYFDDTLGSLIEV